MGKLRLFNQVFCGLFLFFGAPKVALSQLQSAAPKNTPRTLTILDIHIPSAAGYVIETHTPAEAAASYPAVLVHIQEAHTNYEAQQNIVQILEQLVKDYNLKLILVEGSSGDVGIAHLRSYSPATHRKRVAEKYLRAGLISAEEYLDLVSGYPLLLWGIEDEALYQENVRAFFGSEPLQKSIKPQLDALRQAAETLRERILDPALNTLDAQAVAFDERQITLLEYAGTLERLAQQQAMALENFPHLVRFLTVRDQEKSLQLKKVQLEQRLLMASLSTRLPQETFNPLMARAKSMQSGDEAAVSFYSALEDAAHTAEIEMSAYPNLAEYVRYIRASFSVSTTDLNRDLDSCAAELRTRLTKTPESRELRTILDTLRLLEKLLAFRLAPEEYQQLLNIAVDTSWPRWEKFLAEQSEAAGAPARSLEGLRRISEELPALKRFYEIARARDEVMVRNALGKLQESKEPLAVLITGGFHSPRITAMLRDNGVPTIMLIPKVSQATDDRLYRAVVRYKSGQGGSFEEVMALANKAKAAHTTAEAVRP